MKWREEGVDGSWTMEVVPRDGVKDMAAKGKEIIVRRL